MSSTRISRAMLFAVFAGALAAAAADATALNAAKPQVARTAATRAWTQRVVATPAGGFAMGNPAAPVKLVEYGSMTCPHCARFEESAVPHLLDYVKKGEVQWEFRNYVRDAYDVSASLVARCNGTTSFFPLTRALYKGQEKWLATVEAVPAEKKDELRKLAPNRFFGALAKLAGFQTLGAANGVTVAKSSQCLADEAAVEQLVGMARDVAIQYPDFAGTPSFLINGSLVDFGRISEAELWPALERKIRAALGERG